jgi:amidase
VLPAQQPASDFSLAEATIAGLQEEMTSGGATARRIADAYLQRIRSLDRDGPGLHAVLTINPDALTIADSLDAERRSGHVRGALHGIPVLIKDNIDTADRMPTTAGSLALASNHAAADAFLVARLRDAGAVILGKTNLSEWANFRSTASASGWSAVGGQVRNPYVLDRSPCGSSSGTGAAIAANFAAAGIGTETDGSILCPSGVNALVGIKPTVGLVSRRGIIPISRTQDTAGPMARTVADAAVLLEAIAGSDPRDAATQVPGARSLAGIGSALRTDALAGARLGVPRRRYFGYSAATDRVMTQAIADLRRLGAVIVDPADVPTAATLDECELPVLEYEFKAGLNEYLGALPASSPVHSLQELIVFNEQHKDEEMPFFGQELFIASQARGPLTDDDYRQALAACRERSRARGLDAVFARYRLDAIIMPPSGPAWTIDLVNGDHTLGGGTTPAAVAGYPSITVPAGMVHGLPVGLSFIGPAWSEARLVGLAFAYEQATHHRQPPQFLPALPLPSPRQ